MNETSWKTDNQNTVVEDFSVKDMMEKLRSLKTKKRYENFMNIPPVKNIHDEKAKEGFDNGFLNGTFGLNDSDYDGHDNVKDEGTDVNKPGPFSRATDAIAKAIKYILDLIPHLIYLLAILIYLIFSGGETINTDSYGPEDLRKGMTEEQAHDVDIIYNYICWIFSVLFAIPITYGMYFFSFYKETVTEDKEAPKEAYDINPPSGTQPKFNSPGGSWLPLLFGFDHKKTMDMYCSYGNDTSGKMSGMMFLLVPLFILFEPSIRALDIVNMLVMRKIPQGINGLRNMLSKYGINISYTFIFFVMAALFSQALYYGSGYLRTAIPDMLKFKLNSKGATPYPLMLIIAFVTIFPFLSTFFDLGKLAGQGTSQMPFGMPGTGDNEEKKGCDASPFGNGLYIPYWQLGKTWPPIDIAMNIFIMVFNILRFMGGYLLTTAIAPIFVGIYILFYLVLYPITSFGTNLSQVMKNIDITKVADGASFNSFFTTFAGRNVDIPDEDIKRVVDETDPAGILGWVSKMTKLMSRLSTLIFMPVFTILMISLVSSAAMDFSGAKNNTIRALSVPMFSALTLLLVVWYIHSLMTSGQTSARTLLETYLNLKPAQGVDMKELVKKMELLINKHGTDTNDRWSKILEDFKEYFDGEYKTQHPNGDWAKYGATEPDKKKPAGGSDGIELAEFKQAVYRYLTHSARSFSPIHAMMRGECNVREMFNMDPNYGNCAQDDVEPDVNKSSDAK